LVNYATALQNAIRQGFCSILQSNEAFFDFWDRFDPVYPGVESGFNRNLYRSICNREPPDGTPQPGIEGGQCQFVQYSVDAVTQLQDKETGVVRTVNRSYTCLFPDNIYGPIGNPFLDNSNPATAFVQFSHRNAQDNPVVSILAQFDSNVETWIGTQVAVNRCDGQPDNCGDSPPPPPPDGYDNYVTNITYIDENNTQITIPVNINYRAPFVDIDANVRIPVDITINDPVINQPVSFDADFNVSTDVITFNFGNQSGGDGRPRDCQPQPDDGGDTPAPPPDSNSPDEPRPEDPEEEGVIRGCIVTVSVPSQDATQIIEAPPLPVLYVPSLGYVLFRVRAGRSATAWMTPIPVKLTREYVECPASFGAIDVKFFPRFGTVATVTPIYGNNERPQSET